MFNRLRYLIKHLICGKELAALRRYQLACGQAWRWNGQLPNSAETARWIREVGEGRRGMDIEQFREALTEGRDPFYGQQGDL